MKSAEVKTVDDLVFYVKTHKTNGEFETEQQTCEAIIKFYSNMLLYILRDKPNTTSKYDLMLIHEIGEYKRGLRTVIKNIQEILQIYRSRI